MCLHIDMYISFVRKVAPYSIQVHVSINKDTHVCCPWSSIHYSNWATY